MRRRPRRDRTGVGRAAGPALLFAAIVALALALIAAPAGVHAAQRGLISGSVSNGTAGAELDEARVMLIKLDGGGVVGSDEQSVDDGRYAFEVDVDADYTYVLRAVYQGVQYFSDAVTISADQPSAVRDFVVYEPTHERPALSIDVSTVTVVALDRAGGRITLLREDLVRNPADRVWVGDERGTTLSIPAPDRTVEAAGLSPLEDSVRLEGPVAITDVDMFPGVTSVVSRYVVSYERDRDEYRLRVTAPLSSELVQLRVPERFVRRVDLVEGGRRGGAQEIEGERLIVVERTGVRAGQGLVVDLEGLSGLVPAVNPLTERRGAAIASVLALAILVGAGIAFARRAAAPIEERSEP